MKTQRFIVIVVLLVCVFGTAYATTNPVSSNPRSFVVDTFDDGNISKDPEWWSFGNISLTVNKNKPETDQEKKLLTGQSVVVTGESKNWYYGGMGRYMGIDMSSYQTLKMVVYSPKENSGIIKVQLFDDDNGNWHVDQQVSDDSAERTVSHDDVFSYAILCNWKGWKLLSIPLADFKDSNPSVGDNIWNPYYSSRSGGMLQLQLLFFSSKEKKESLSIQIDSIKFTSLED